MKGRASLCFVLSDSVFQVPIGPRMAPQDTYREMTYNITNYHVAGTYGLLTRDCCYELPRRIDLDDILSRQIYLVDILVRIVKLSEPVVIQHHLMFDCYIVKSSQWTCVGFDLPGFRKMSANAWYTHYCLKCMWMET
jgi:hypothetical protein